MNLNKATRDLHHAVENTWLGEALVLGAPSTPQYAAWIAIELPVAMYLRPDLGDLARVEGYLADQAALIEQAPTPEAVWEHLLACQDDHTGRLHRGLMYVFLGAKLRGGPVLLQELSARGYPVAHMEVTAQEMKRGLAMLRPLRGDMTLVEAAKRAFEMYLEACKEVEVRLRGPDW